MGSYLENDIPFEQELNTFHQASKIPLCIFDSTSAILFCYPQNVSIVCQKEVLEECCEKLQKRGNMERIPLLYTSDNFFFGVIELAENVNVMIGPVSPSLSSYRKFYENSYRTCAREDFLFLYRLLQQSPSMSLMQFANYLCLFVRMIFQKNISCENLLENPLQMPQMNTLSMEKGDEKQHYLTIAEAIAFQKEIVFLIQLGDLKGIERRFQETIIFDGLEDSSFVIEDLKRIFYVFAIECCEMAMEEGVDIERAFSIFEQYKPQMINLVMAEELGVLCKHISMDYCQEICILKGKQKVSPVVYKCMQFIHENNNAKIGLEDLASYCKTSGRTISRHFKECLHTSVSDYILQQKLEKAVFLLENSDLTLAEISNYLAFSSQSHFTVAFKKRYFTTPQKYREKILNI